MSGALRSPPVGRTAYNGSAVWGSRSSVYVRRTRTRSRASRRRGPVGAATDEVLVGHIRGCEASFMARKAWANCGSKDPHLAEPATLMPRPPGPTARVMHTAEGT